MSGNTAAARRGWLPALVLAFMAWLPAWAMPPIEHYTQWPDIGDALSSSASASRS